MLLQYIKCCLLDSIVVYELGRTPDEAVVHQGQCLMNKTDVEEQHGNAELRLRVPGQFLSLFFHQKT